MTRLCLVLLSVIISVSSNPLGQLVQSCSVCQPTTYTNTAPIPVVIQQPSNNNPYPQSPAAQTSTGFPGPLGDQLNQIILNRLLSNPSFQKIIDPNTRLYNQNGDEVQRQVLNTATPNVINNYFIVPPEFFNLNETTKNEAEEIVKINKPARKSHRRKTKKRPSNIEFSSGEDENATVVKKGKMQVVDKVKRKHTRVNVDKRVEAIDEVESQEVDRRREKDSNRKQRLRKKFKKRRPITVSNVDESNEDDLQEIEDHIFVKQKIRENDTVKPRKQKLYSNNVDTIDDSLETTSRAKTSEKDVISTNTKIDLDKVAEISETEKPKKQRRKKLERESEDNTLKNIEMPADIYERNSPENRKGRDSKRNAAKNERRQKVTPVSDDYSKTFFPYMPSGNFYNPATIYPYNFDQYYQYLDPFRNFNANSNRNKKKRKNKNRRNNDENSNTHTIEITLIPSNNIRIADTSLTPEAEYVTEKIDSEETERSTESLEFVTEIPMQIPQKVSPKGIIHEEEPSNKESYETFSKLEDLYEYITPELGREDVVPTMHSNGIINDYYPVFDDDVYYAPYVENESLDDDRYFYETGIEEFTRERRKNDKYEDYRSPSSYAEQFVYSQENKTNGKNLGNAEFIETNKKDFVGPAINKFNHKEYLDHISSFSDVENPDYQTPSTEIRRIQVPSKNTRVKAENIETVYAGSKVAKYGVPPRATADDNSYISNTDKNSYVGNDDTAYVFAKSLGRPEDYW